MRCTLDRTKVVLRHLPPAISGGILLERIDGAFAGRYNWVSLRPGKNSLKNLSYSRAYIDFKMPEDVVEFAEFFNGHVFVNEKGTQFKTVVEYAPSQRVPKQWSKKDGREGTIYEDPEYLEFLEVLAKPVEYLPSAEIQLERREAEQSGAAKDILIVTPLMDFVRQKRAARGGSQRSLSNGKPGRRSSGPSTGGADSASSRQGSEKRRASTKMYVMRDKSRSATGKNKSAYISVPKQDDKQISDRTTTVDAAVETETFEVETGVAGINDVGNKKILHRKLKDRDVIKVSDSMPQQKSVSSSARTILGSAAVKHRQRLEGGGRIVRSVLINKDSHRSLPSRVLSPQQTETSNLENDKRPHWPLHVQFIFKGTKSGPEDKAVGNDFYVNHEEQEKHTRHKEKPDLGLRAGRIDDESLSSAASQTSQLDSSEGSLAELKLDMATSRNGEMKTFRGGRVSQPSSVNGSRKHLGRRGHMHGEKDIDCYIVSNEGKHLRRGGASSYGSHEKRVWVQKASSGS